MSAKYQCTPFRDSFGYLYIQHGGKRLTGGYEISEGNKGDLKNFEPGLSGGWKATWVSRSSGKSGRVFMTFDGNQLTSGHWLRSSGGAGGSFSATLVEGHLPAHMSGHGPPQPRINASVLENYARAVKHVYHHPAPLKRAYAKQAHQLRKVQREALLWRDAVKGVYFDRDPEFIAAFGKGVAQSAPMDAYVGSAEAMTSVVIAAKRALNKLAATLALRVGPWLPSGIAFAGAAVVDVLDYHTAMQKRFVPSCTIALGFCLVRFSETKVQPYITFTFGAGFDRNFSLGTSLVYCGSSKKNDQGGWQALQLTASVSQSKSKMTVGGSITVPNVVDRISRSGALAFAKEIATGTILGDAEVGKGAYVEVGDNALGLGAGILLERAYNLPLGDFNVDIHPAVLAAANAAGGGKELLEKCDQLFCSAIESVKKTVYTGALPW